MIYGKFPHIISPYIHISMHAKGKSTPKVSITSMGIKISRINHCYHWKFLLANAFP